MQQQQSVLLVVCRARTASCCYLITSTWVPPWSSFSSSSHTPTVPRARCTLSASNSLRPLAGRQEGSTDKADRLAGRSPRTNAQHPCPHSRLDFHTPAASTTSTPLTSTTTTKPIPRRTYRPPPETRSLAASQCTYPPPAVPLLTLPTRLCGSWESGCVCKRAIALARETHVETYRKDATDPFASVVI